VTPSSTTQIMVSGSSNGTVFRLSANFVPLYKAANRSTAGTDQVVDVTLRNPRRD
jgi:hypothetical protein